MAGRRAATSCSAPSTPSPRRSSATGWSARSRTGSASTSATSTSTAAASTRWAAPRRCPSPPRRRGVVDDWTGSSRAGRRPGPDALRLARAGRRRHDDRSGRTSRTPTRTTASSRSTSAGSVFYPTEHHVDYITVRGFELARRPRPGRHRPPTSRGSSGPNWAKGWIIEDNHHPRREVRGDLASARRRRPGTTTTRVRGDKPGYQYQLESVFSARQIGWDKEHIGSHVIRRNTIYDCGQCAIVGHLGCCLLHDRGQPHPPHRAEARVLRVRDRRHQAARGHRRRDHPQPDPRLLARHLARLADPGHPGRAQPDLRQLPRPLRRGEPRPLRHRPQPPRPRRVSIESFSQGGAYVNNLVCGTRRPGAGDGPGHALSPPAQHPGRRVRGDLRRGRPLDRQPLRSAATSTPPTDRTRTPDRRRTRHAPATTATPPTSRSTSP